MALEDLDLRQKLRGMATGTTEVESLSEMNQKNLVLLSAGQVYLRATM